MPMRTIIHTHDSTSPGITRDIAETLEDWIEEHTTRQLRSTSGGEPESSDHRSATLCAYTAPDGSERFVVDAYDDNSRYVADTESFEESEAAYEHEVRSFAGCTHLGQAPWWDRSDVDGIALGCCTAMVAVLTGGEWAEDDEAEELVLGQPLDGFRDAPQTLEDLLHMLLGQTADERLEYQHDGSAEAVRVTVTGTTADGEVTMTAERHRHDQPTGPEPLTC